MLANEAIRLVLQQEPNHDLLTGKRQSTAPAHDRRHAHAPACPKTKDIYLRVVREFALFLGRSPDTATVEDLRRYQVPATHPKTRCELRRHSFNKRRCKQRLDTRTEFGRFEFDNLIARDLLAKGSSASTSSSSFRLAALTRMTPPVRGICGPDARKRPAA
jgi:hypothetical protein